MFQCLVSSMSDFHTVLFRSVCFFNNVRVSVCFHNWTELIFVSFGKVHMFMGEAEVCSLTSSCFCSDLYSVFFLNLEMSHN